MVSVVLPPHARIAVYFCSVCSSQTIIMENEVLPKIFLDFLNIRHFPSVPKTESCGWVWPEHFYGSTGAFKRRTHHHWFLSGFYLMCLSLLLSKVVRYRIRGIKVSSAKLVLDITHIVPILTHLSDVSSLWRSFARPHTYRLSFVDSFQ